MNWYHVRLHWSKEDDWSGWHQAESLSAAVDVAISSLSKKTIIPLDRVQITVNQANDKQLSLFGKTNKI